MSDDRGQGIRDVFLEYFKRYEGYHGAKETLVWLAATVYMGFAAATLNWLATTTAHWCSYRPWIGAGIGVVCFLLSWFLWLQNGYKAGSVNISNMLDDWLPRLDGERPPTFSDLHAKLKCAQEKQVHRWSPGGGLAGSVLLLLVVVLGLAQILMVSCYPAP
jgi:hypothetical protein